MRSKRLSVLCLMVLPLYCFSQGELQLKQASGHPMMYYISLPVDWSSSKEWPVVFILEAAEKEFRKNAERFVEARGNMPFILVAPVNTNNGRQGRRDPAVFPYSERTWDYIERVGDCQFNADGIRQIISDVQNEFNGEAKIYLTGFEAGAHDLWSIVFNHPEYLKAAAPVAGNYRGRCVDVGAISKDPSKESLHIMGFVGQNDEPFGPASELFNQWSNAKNIAQANGYSEIGETVVPHKGHVPMPGEVLAFFSKIRASETTKKSP